MLSFEFFWNKYGILIGLAFIVSVIALIASLIIIPLVIVKMRKDYFLAENRRISLMRHRFPALVPVIFIIRNVTGFFLMLAGIVMLLTPGQGLLTIFSGLLVMDFPAKYKLEKWLISKKSVYLPINWLRQKAGKDPLLLPENSHLIKIKNNT